MFCLDCSLCLQWFWKKKRAPLCFALWNTLPSLQRGFGGLEGRLWSGDHTHTHQKWAEGHILYSDCYHVIPLQCSVMGWAIHGYDFPYLMEEICLALCEQLGKLYFINKVTDLEQGFMLHCKVELVKWFNSSHLEHIK